MKNKQFVENLKKLQDKFPLEEERFNYLLRIASQPIYNVKPKQIKKKLVKEKKIENSDFQKIETTKDGIRQIKWIKR